jgi:hypothetical protein
MVSLPALILSVVLMFGFTPRASQFGPLFRRPDKPINCEYYQAQLDIAIIEWRKLKESKMIFIARLGDGEKDRKLNRMRMSYIEDYLNKKDVQYVFAEGERVKGFGRMELYVGGRLVMFTPLMKGSRRLCWGSNGE